MSLEPRNDKRADVAPQHADGQAAGKEGLCDLVEHCIRSYYTKDYRPMLDCTSDDCVWLGAGNMLYFGRDSLAADLSGTYESIDFIMRNQSFWLIETGHADDAVVMGVYDLYSEAGEKAICAVHQRITAFLRVVDGAWRCIHMHASNEWDVLAEDEHFPVAVARQTYRYVQRIIKTAERTTSQHTRLELKLGGASVFVDPDLITHIEAASKESVIHFLGGIKRVGMLLGDLEKLLPREFVRVHRSYVVNSRYVRAMEHFSIDLATGETVPVSEKRFKEVHDELVALISRASHASA